MVILDFLLPELDGKSVIIQLRKISDTPFVLLSSLNDEESIVKAFELGAEDYIRKPFYPKELLARVKVIFRSRMPAQELPKRNLSFDGLYIEPSRTSTVEDRLVGLTPKEYDYCFMASKPNQALGSCSMKSGVLIITVRIHRKHHIKPCGMPPPPASLYCNSQRSGTSLMNSIMNRQKTGQQGLFY